VPSALAALVALAPGLLVWLWGLRLVQSSGDPALPERVHAWRQRSIAAFATGAALLLVLFSSELTWSLPLLFLAFLAGGFPVRRALFGETWSLAGYLFHVARAVLGFAGFWLLLMAAPALVSWATPREWVTAAVLASVLLAWGLLHDRVLLRLLRAVPLDRPDLEPRLAAIAARSSAPMPRLYVIGPPGGRWANAVALPSTGQPAVAFTRTLQEELEADEIAAIFAHEQAHLEYFDRRRVIRLAAVQATAVLLGTLGAAAVLPRLGAATLVVTAGWPLAVSLALVMRLARHQAHEADSDRRAAELCGDPGALARGLVRLHQLALFPRRVELEREQWESHPSLASRLRALRALADQGPEVAGVPSGERPTPSLATRPPVALAGAVGGAWLVFETDQAHWLEGVPDDTAREPGALRAAARRARSLAYAELVELRLKPRGRDRHALVATDRTGASWTLALAPGEGQSAQSALDGIDERLSPTSAAPRGYRPVATIVAAAGTIGALLVLSSAFVPGLVAVFLPHPGPLAALGAGLVVSTFASPPVDVAGLLEGIPSALQIAVLLALGAAALALAWVTAWRERAGRTRSAPWVGLLLCLAAAVPLLLIVAPFVTGSALRLHLAARQHPAGAVLLAAAAAALLVNPRGWSRALGVASALLATLILTVASDPFADRFVHDPLWVKQAPGPPPPVALRFLTEHPLPVSTAELRLSSSGRSWLTRGYDRDDDRGAVPRPRLVVGSVRGVEHAHHALDVALLDDERLLALHESASELALVCGRHDPSGPEEWRLALPTLVSPRLAVDRATGAWQVAGVEPTSGELVRLQGDVAGHSPHEYRWPADDRAGQWLVSAGPTALGVGYAFNEEDVEEPAALADAAGLWWLLAGLSGDVGSRVLALDADGSRPLLDSQLMVQCDEPPPGLTAFVCRAHAGERTSLWSVDPSVRQQRLIGVVAGFAGAPRPAASGGLVLTQEGRGQALYRLGEAGLVRLDRPHASGESLWIVDAVGFANGVGVVVAESAGRSRLRLYARDDSVPTRD
jgi:heat shock protein HtpX